MSESIISIIKSLNDSLACRVKLTTFEGDSSVIDCVYKEDISPNFFLVFEPGAIPKNLDNAVVCNVSFDDITPPISLDARIVSKFGDRTLNMKGHNAFDPSTMREYFRVEMRTKITATYFPDDPVKEKGWEMSGETLDLSGTGALAVFPNNIAADMNLMLDIHLDYYDETISCFAKVIRCRRLRSGKYQTAFALEQLNQKSRDMLITCCLHEQRKSLRTKVQTLS